MADEDKYNVKSFVENLKGLGAGYWLPSLAATLGAGGLAGYMSSKAKGRPGETPEQRRARILRNAALAAGLTGAGTLGLGAYKALDAHKFDTEGSWMNTLFNKAPNETLPTVGAVGGGALGWMGADSMTTNSLSKSDALKDLKSILGRDASNILTMSPSAITANVNVLKNKLEPKHGAEALAVARKMFEDAGINPDGRTRILSALNRGMPNATVGKLTKSTLGKILGGGVGATTGLFLGAGGDMLGESLTSQ
jgi:hypothetical protein